MKSLKVAVANWLRGPPAIAKILVLRIGIGIGFIARTLAMADRNFISSYYDILKYTTTKCHALNITSSVSGVASTCD